jgi:hypothetical protein
LREAAGLARPVISQPIYHADNTGIGMKFETMGGRLRAENLGGCGDRGRPGDGLRERGRDAMVDYSTNFVY